MPQSSKGVPNPKPLTEDDFQKYLVAGLARVAAKIGTQSLAKSMSRSVRQLGNVMGGSTPDAIAMFDALLADHTVLDELLAAYGFRLTPLHSQAANDLLTAAGVIDAMGTLVGALTDGHRDHSETLEVAKLLRPHMAAMTAIVRQADELRGAA